MERSSSTGSQRAVRLRVVLALVVCAGLAYAWAQATPSGRRAELSTVDARFALRGQDHREPASVAVVAINDETDHRLESRFPYARQVYADAIRELHRAGARAVVFDVNFDFASGSAADDAALVRAARDAAPVVFVTGTQELDRGAIMPRVPLQELRVPGVEPGGAFAYSRATFGLASLTADVDGRVRRWSTRSELGGDSAGPRTRPSLALAALRASGAGTERQLDQLPDELLLDHSTSADAVAQINLADLVTDPAGRQPAARIVRGRTVFIGATSQVLHDVYETPFEAAVPGVVLHAQAFETMRSGRWLTAAPGWFGPLVAVVLVLLWGVAVLRLPFLLGCGLGAGATVAYAAAAVVAFDSWHVVLPLAAPIAAAVAAGSFLVVRFAAVAVGERRRITAMFARYVAPTVVRKLVRTGDVDAIVAGERCEITVLFADLRGFTAMSEHADPQQLVRQLNEYLAAMTTAIHHAGGTIDKFLGDGIMAVFGAPIPQDDHAARACAAARAMLTSLEEVNARRCAVGLPVLCSGIGIASGTAIVGNVGSDQRFDYTAIGDCVNLAARLQQLTARYDVPVLIGGATRDALAADATSDLGTVQIRGRLQPTPIATLTGVGTLPPAFVDVDVPAA